MKGSSVGSERSSLQFTRPGGLGKPITMFSKKLSKRQSPESRRGTSPRLFSSATSAAVACCLTHSCPGIRRSTSENTIGRASIVVPVLVVYAYVYITEKKPSPLSDSDTGSQWSPWGSLTAFPRGMHCPERSVTTSGTFYVAPRYHEPRRHPRISQDGCCWLREMHQSCEWSRGN